MNNFNYIITTYILTSLIYVYKTYIQFLFEVDCVQYTLSCIDQVIFKIIFVHGLDKLLYML